MPLRIPRPRFRLWWLIALVAAAALAIFALMPVRPGFVDLKEGAGPAVAAGDTVDVHYVGRLGGTRLSDWLKLGKEFDSSRGRNAPFTFPAGGGLVIRGWDLGVLGMKAGGVRKLVIPPAAAYGEKGMPPVIPPNSTLIFEVEMLGVRPKPGR
jgi:FKBP-type peptidyl-prolyl cis-trans isomerase FkpA